MTIQPYLFFDGRCEEALGFYREAIGAEVTMLMRYRDNPERNPAMEPPNAADKVMHARVQVGDAVILASDGRCQGMPDFKGFALSLTASGTTEAERMFTALAAGGQVAMPLGKTFFSPSFGMTTDRFGVMWMVYVPE